ncbi:MAG: nuclear transport factor 2 family protein [Myxococcota bacterium]
MGDIEQVKAALNEWTEGLDGGDLERMIRTCDPEVVICNERQPTTVGIAAVRQKYGPRIEAGTFRSGFDIERIKVYGDFALIVGHFTVDYTHRGTGDNGGGEGRLVIVYRRHRDGSWKMLLDVDNNDERSGAKP